MTSPPENLAAGQDEPHTQEPSKPSTDAGQTTPESNAEEVLRPSLPEEPIVFTDNLGAKWVLPFEVARTWDGMKALLKKILWETNLNWHYNQFYDSEDEGKRKFSIVRVPDEIHILPTLWDKVIKPGWHIRIEFEGETSFIKEIIEERAAEAKEKAAKEDVEDNAEGEENAPAEKEYQEITYMANFYQQDGTTLPDFLRRMEFEKPVGNDIEELPGQKKAILCETRNVFFGRTKKTQAEEETYKNIQSDDLIGSYMLEVQSTALLDALRAVIQFQSPPDDDYYDRGFRIRDEFFTDLRMGRFVFPYLDLYHHMDELTAYKDKKDGHRARHKEEYNIEQDRHIDVLIRYLQEQPTIAFLRATEAWSRRIPVTTFDWLWLLLKPGSDVYVPERGQMNAYVIESVEGISRTSTSRARPYRVKLWNLDFDGKTFGRSTKTVLIHLFDGEREIQTLPVYPVRFHQDKEGDKPLRETLVERGKIFVDVIKKPTYQEYTGPSSFIRAKKYNQARVMVDHTSRPWEEEVEREPDKHLPGVGDDESLGTNTRFPACPCAICSSGDNNAEKLFQRLKFDDYDEIPLDTDLKLTEHQYFLCYSHVYAFVLQDRIWDLVEVKGLEVPQIEEKVIDTLVLRPESNKSMIKAICETYTIREDREGLFFADYIKGKGEGQIILLHGPPGTGKTLTAESVAEYTRRPLLSITAADLGHDTDLLENNLLRFFRNADKWDAIVLLDEADIYLERRSTNELRRNSIVSIFLRQLDYFKGILFLTTNRVGSFDEAFMSRIHILIGYESLDKAARAQIWANAFDKLESHAESGGREITFSIGAKEYVNDSTKLEALKWNGREIRNAFQTAVALATFEAKQKRKPNPRVTESHLSQIVEMSSTFKKYMRSTLQADHGDVAQRLGLRDDTFKLVPVARQDRDD